VPIASPLNVKPVKVEASVAAAKDPTGLATAYPRAKSPAMVSIPGAKAPVAMLLSIKPGCSISKDMLHPEVLYVKGTDGKIYETKAEVGDLRVNDKRELECLVRDAKGHASWVPVKTASAPTTKVDPQEFLAVGDKVKPYGRLPIDGKGKPVDVDSVYFDKAKLTWVDKGGNEVFWKGI
jgi:hypothetical protein